MDLVIKSFDNKKGIDRENRTISGWVSKYEVDRDNEIVKPTAFEKNLDIYLRNGPLLMFHNHKSLPCGKVIEAKIYPEEGVWAKFYITKNPIGDEILNLVEEGCLNGFSAGFVPIKFEENPSIHKIAQHALRNSMGKKIRKQYEEVEWVETSLLPIPSNRSSLIDRAEKGNQVAGLILKSFDISKYEDLELVIKEWMVANKESFTLKSLLSFDPAEHPRDDSGKFTESGHVSNVLNPIRESNYYPKTDTPLVSTNRASQESSAKLGEANKKLSDISEKQDLMRNELIGIHNQGSWSSWFKKWGIVTATAIAGYFLVKHGKSLVKTAKGMNESDDRVKSLLALMKEFLDKGKELGLTDTDEYKKAEKFYTNAISKMPTNKGLSSLLITMKEMTPETFVEEEHPRHTDGKFRRKAEGAGAKKTKVEDVHHEIEDHSEVKVTYSKSIQKFGHEKGQKFMDWAKNNKGKILITAASFPIIFTAVKGTTSLISVTKSKNARSLTSWDDVLKAGKHKEIYDQIQPGDIILSGIMPHKNISEIGSDVNKVVKFSLKDKVGLKVGSYVEPSKALHAEDRLMELASKVATEGQYTHSFMCVGKLDENFLAKVSSFASTSPENAKKANYLLSNIVLDINTNRRFTKETIKRFKALQYLGENGKMLNMPTDIKQIRDTFDFTKVDFTPYFGVPLTVKGGRGVPSLGVFLAPHSGRVSKQDVIAAVARTKLKKESIDKVVNGTIDDIFNQNQTGIVHPWTSEVLIRPTSRGGLFDPITGRIIGSFVRNDQVVCSGVIAKLFERHGAKIFDDASVVSPMDFVKNEKLIESALIPKKGQNSVFLTREAAKKIKADSAMPSDIKIGIAATAGTVGVGTLAATHPEKVKETYQQTKERLKKGLSSLLVTKEMSAEEFEESEHPRDSDGKFRDKNSAAAPSASKTSHGGYREGAGRLPKDPVEATQKLTEKIKSQNPNVPDEEVKKQLIKHAVDNRKTDMYLHLTDPVAYQKQKEQQMMDAMSSSYRRGSVNGKKLSPINNSDDVKEASQDVKQSVSNWNKEVAQAKTLHEAVKTYNDKESEAAEVRKARIIMGVAALATIAVGAGIWLKRPKTGLRYNPELDKLGAARTILSNDMLGHPLETSKATYLAIAKEMKPFPSTTEAIGILKELDKEHIIYTNDVGTFQRFISGAAQKLGLVPEGHQIVLGKKLVGINTERFRFGRYFRFATDSNTRLAVNDADALTGLRIVDIDGTINARHLAQSIGVIPNPNTAQVEIPGLRKLVRADGNAVWEYEPNGGKLTFIDWLNKKGIISDVKVGKTGKNIELITGEFLEKELPKVEVESQLTLKEVLKKNLGRIYGNDARFDFDVPNAYLPKNLARKWTSAASKAQAEAVEKHQSTALWIGEHAIPLVSRKTMALLVPLVGIGGSTAYLYQKDFETFSKAIHTYSTSQNDAAQTELLAQAAMAYNKKDNKSIDKQIQLSKARTKESEKKTILENFRANMIDRLINELNVRKDLEGFVTPNTLTPVVIQKRFAQMQSALRYGNSESELDRFDKDMRDPVKSKDMLLWIADAERRDREKAKKGEKPADPSMTPTERTPEKEAEHAALREELTQDNLFKTAKGIEDLIIIKGMLDNINDIENADDNRDVMSLDEVTTLVALEIGQMFYDISSASKAMIDNGVPGHSDYEDISHLLMQIYVYMKENAKTVNNDEVEIEGKSIDKTDIKDSESIVTEEKPDKCPLCNKVATEEVIMNCKKTDCQYNFLDQIEEKA